MLVTIAKVGVLSSANQLGLTQGQLAIILNLDSIETLNSLELDPDSSQGELAIILIRIAISLDALIGGEAKWMQHFMKAPNKLTKGIPIEQIQHANYKMDLEIAKLKRSL